MSMQFNRCYLFSFFFSLFYYYGTENAFGSIFFQTQKCIIFCVWGKKEQKAFEPKHGKCSKNKNYNIYGTGEYNQPDRFENWMTSFGFSRHFSSLFIWPDRMLHLLIDLITIHKKKQKEKCIFEKYGEAKTKELSTEWRQRNREREKKIKKKRHSQKRESNDNNDDVDAKGWYYYYGNTGKDRLYEEDRVTANE